MILTAFNFEFLKESPILEIETNRYICLSFPYLISRAVNGVREIVRTRVTDRFNGELGKALGDAYEEYVNSILKETYSYYNHFAPRVINKKNKSIQVSDGVIDYGDEVIFIEVKAKSIQKNIN
ncbi:hypothetical protein ACONDI_00500 [Natranaerofaba carboxydovora]|nr:hypothetical protein ACONDI_00500 [Natranaerofaba carboxydovora]